MLFIILVTFVVFRDYVGGADTYYFINHICYDSQIDSPILSDWIFGVLPCHTPTLKIFQIFLYILSIIPIYLIGKMYEKKLELPKYISLFLIFASLSLSFAMLGNLEDDQLAFPLLFWAQYFYIKYIHNKGENFVTNLYRLGIPISLIFISFFLWKGTLLYIGVFFLLSRYTIMLLIPMIFIFWKYIGRLIPNFDVLENLPIIGIFYLNLNILGIYLFFTKEDLHLKLMFALFLIIGILNTKYIIHALPLSIVGMMYLWKEKIHGVPKKELIMISLVVIMTIFSGMVLYKSAPTEDLFVGIHNTYSLGEDMNIEISNDWSIGYFIEYAGYEARYKGHPSLEYDFNNKIVITSFSDFNLDKYCTEHTHEEHYRIWICPVKGVPYQIEQ